MSTIKSIYTIAAKEILERRSLLGVSLGLGLLPFVGLQAKRFGLELGRNDVGAISTVNMMVFTVIFALIVGGSLFGREFAERRMSFYFVRPISSAAIWFGKVSGGLLLSLLSGALMIVPVLCYFGFSNETRDLFTTSAITNYFLITVFFLSAGMVLGIFFRSKSAWLALDLAMVPVALGVLALSMLYIFSPYGANSLSMLPLDQIFGVLGLMMLGTSAVAVIAGRADIKRAHRALSLSFWSLIIAGLIGFNGYWMWYLSPAPSDLTSIADRVIPGVGGKWVMLSGHAWGRSDFYYPTFFVNTNNGQYVNVGPAYSYDIEFSASGSRAAWATYEGKLQGGRFRISTLDLSSDNAAVKKTSITYDEKDRASIKLSADGKYLAKMTEKMVTVYDVANEKEIAAAFIPSDALKHYYQRAQFLSADLLRVYAPQSANGVMDIYDFDLKANKAEKIGSMTGHENSAVVISPSGDRVLWQSAFGSVFVTLYDGKTGTLLNNLSIDDRSLNQYAKFLADGRVAMIISGQKKVTLKVFNHDGVEERNVDLGDGSGLGIGAEVAPGKLLVTLNKEEYSLIRDSGETFIVDINDGTITKRFNDMKPSSFFIGWTNGTDHLAMIDANTVLMINKDKTLSRVNVETGASQSIETLKLHK